MSQTANSLPHTPLLSAIDSPADLRKLSVSELPGLCDEIRRFLIHSLADNPGHFASSMGAVELTVALHYVLTLRMTASYGMSGIRLTDISFLLVVAISFAVTVSWAV